MTEPRHLCRGEGYEVCDDEKEVFSMKKRILSLALFLSLAVSLFVPAFAAEDATQPVTPTAPEWINEEDYIIFPGDEVYLPENWAEIEELREQARNGKVYHKSQFGGDVALPEDFNACSPGQLYEYGLINLRYAINAESRWDCEHAAYQADFWCFRQILRRDLDLSEDTYYKVCLLRDRMSAISFMGEPSSWGESLVPTLTYFNMTMDDFFGAPYMELVSKENRTGIFKDVSQYLTEQGMSVTQFIPNPIIENDDPEPEIIVGADGLVVPTAPEWVREEDYLIFPGDEVYKPENWAEIEELREEARNGAEMVTKWDMEKVNPNQNWRGGSAGRAYEIGLVWLKYAENRGVESSAGKYAIYSAGQAFRDAGSYWKIACEGEMDALYDELFLREVRANLIFDYEHGDSAYWGKAVGGTLVQMALTLEDFYDAPYMDLVSEETRFLVYQDIKAYLTERGYLFTSTYVQPSPVKDIQLFLDDYLLETDVPAVITNGRTMIPIRAVAEALGADVGWEETTRQVTLTRAGTTIVMTIDSTTAMVNNVPTEMDVAPYILGGRTLLPVRYVAEFFGQKVEWEESTRRVFISEDKSAAGNSNLEDWAIHMGMIYGSRTYMDRYGQSGLYGKAIRFGIYDRTTYMIEGNREGLTNNWGVSKREDVFRLVPSMTYHGHNDDFQEAAAVANNLTDEDFTALIAMSGATDKYMWPYTKEISERWGDKGILAWDLSRMGAMVQWGYNAGYLTYEEALELIEPAARLTQETFSSWHEFYLNYLDGYSWWARNNIYTARETYEEELKAECGGTLPETYETWMALPRAEDYQRIIDFLDDSLFETGVIGLPEE